MVCSLVERAKETHRRVGSNTKEYLSHPVNVFHLTQRLGKGWRDAIHIIRKSKPCRECESLPKDCKAQDVLVVANLV